MIFEDDLAEFTPDQLANYEERHALEKRLEQAELNLFAARHALGESSSPRNIRQVAEAQERVRYALGALEGLDEDWQNQRCRY